MLFQTLLEREILLVYRRIFDTLCNLRNMVVCTSEKWYVAGTFVLLWRNTKQIHSNIDIIFLGIIVKTNLLRLEHFLLSKRAFCKLKIHSKSSFSISYCYTFLLYRDPVIFVFSATIWTDKRTFNILSSNDNINLGQMIVRMLLTYRKM